MNISVERKIRGTESGTVTVTVVIDGHTVVREIDLSPVANGMPPAWWAFQKMAEVLNESFCGCSLAAKA